MARGETPSEISANAVTSSRAFALNPEPSLGGCTERGWVFVFITTNIIEIVESVKDGRLCDGTSSVRRDRAAGSACLPRVGDLEEASDVGR
jgi:hypothetical protein